MINNEDTDLERLGLFEDSFELAFCLREIAEEMEENKNFSDAYYLRETADSLEALFDHARCLSSHLKRRKAAEKAGRTTT